MMSEPEWQGSAFHHWIEYVIHADRVRDWMRESIRRTMMLNDLKRRDVDRRTRGEKLRMGILEMDLGCIRQVLRL